MKINTTNLDSVEVGEIELKDEVFGTDIRADLMHRYVQWQLAKRRAGTHKVKGRSEIRGTTAKMYKQKGTGRSALGSSFGFKFTRCRQDTVRSRATTLPGPSINLRN